MKCKCLYLYISMSVFEVISEIIKSTCNRTFVEVHFLQVDTGCILLRLFFREPSNEHKCDANSINTAFYYKLYLSYIK